MALPASVTVSNAGTTSANGVYTLAGSMDANGNGYFQLGSTANYIFWGGSLGAAWFMASVLNLTGNARPFYVESSGLTLVAGPVGGNWILSAGLAPSPVVGLYTAPLTPLGVTATVTGNSVSFTSSNTASQPAGTTFSILRGTSTGTENATPVISGIVTLPYTLVEPNAGTFYYKMTATVSGITSAASTETTATIAANSAVVSPSGVIATYLPGKGIQVSWTNGSASYTSVNVYRIAGNSTNNVGQREDANPLQELPGNTTTFTDFGVGAQLGTAVSSNQFSYFVTGTVNGVETSSSNVTTPVTFFG